MVNRSLLVLFFGLTQVFSSDIAGKRLAPGDSVPDVTVQTAKAEKVKLADLASRKPSVLIFYRGGWCPFCTRHLKDLVEIQEDLQKAGVQILAISVDRPEKLRETSKNEQLSYTLLSDSDAAAAKAFGIAFKVDDATVHLYKNSYQIDLEDASGRKHHLLPHPAVFVVDTAGKIKFAHVNEDYKTRLSASDVLKAAREAR
jgi:peroxiredoxin